MTIYNFKSVQLGATKSGKCPCGKRVTRSTTFEQTINPFNKTADGKVKEYSDIYPELKIEREAWLQEPVTHARMERYKLSAEQRQQLDDDGTITLTCGVSVPRKA